MHARAQILAVFAIVLLLLGGTTAAFAHAGLISAVPADGSVLDAAPTDLILSFTEPVSPISFSLIGVGGNPVALPTGRIDDASVEVPLPTGLGKGSYLFSWRVTSEDGHPVNGTVGFAIGAPSGMIAAPPPDPVLVALIWAVRAAQYVALFLGVGAAAFAALTPVPPAARQRSRVLAASGLVLVPLALGLQGVDLLGLPVAALSTTAPWLEAVASPYAQTQGLLALVFVFALLPRKEAALLAGLVGALAPTLSGHASTAEPQLLMRGAVFVHMASLLFWLGALMPLAAALKTKDIDALRDFSRVIPFAIAALLLSGGTLAVVQLGLTPLDWLSPYGALLAAKLALVAILLLLALWNRVRLTWRAKASDVTPLRRSILVELVLVVAILGIVAGWRFTPPPRVLAEIAAASAPLTVPLVADGATGHLDIAPGRSGPVSLTLDLSLAAEAVTVQLSNRGEAIATISKPAQQGSDHMWHVDGVLLPAGGDWSVAVLARTGKFDLSTLTGAFLLPHAAKETSMIPPKLAAALVSSVLLASPATAAGVLDNCPVGQSFTQAGITVTGAFTRATPKGAQSAGAYFNIRNAGPEADTLKGASSAAASDVTLHQMKMNGNIMEMSAIEGGLAIPAGGSASLDPMGNHLMMTGMSQSFSKGQCVQLTLHFAKAGDLPVALNVGGFGQQAPPTDDAASSALPAMDMSGMDMDGMSSMPGM
ncbi:MAG: copper chaperone PCu(A)C [Devosia sp.]